jgi:hypothetical protein
LPILDFSAVGGTRISFADCFAFRFGVNRPFDEWYRHLFGMAHWCESATAVGCGIIQVGMWNKETSIVIVDWIFYGRCVGHTDIFCGWHDSQTMAVGPVFDINPIGIVFAWLNFHCQPPLSKRESSKKWLDI